MLPNLAALGARGGTTGAPGAGNRPLHLTELPPEMLKEILLAVDTGDVETACNTADAWCGVDTNVRSACADASLWTQLTERVFGVEREAESADVATHRAFFRELCVLFKTVLLAIKASDGTKARDAADAWHEKHESARGDPNLWTLLTQRAFEVEPDGAPREFFKKLCEIVVKYRAGLRSLFRHRNDIDSGNRAFVLAAVRAHGTNLSNASYELKNDKEVVLAAVENGGRALEWASGELQNDRDVVLAAVKNEWHAFQFASEGLKQDREFALAVVQRFPRVLRFVDPALKRDRAIVLLAVKSDGYTLTFADETMRADREVVLAAVRSYGPALMLASADLKNNRDFVLTAVERNGWALAWVPKTLKNDRGVVLAAVAQNGWALQWASAELKNDRDIVLVAVRQAGFGAYRHASQELKGDPEIERLNVLRA